eukprot:3882648-Pleurochrysis_carterae.AAC.1
MEAYMQQLREAIPREKAQKRTLFPAKRSVPVSHSCPLCTCRMTRTLATRSPLLACTNSCPAACELCAH